MPDEFEKAFERKVEKLVDQFLESADIMSTGDVENMIDSRIEGIKEDSLETIRDELRDTFTKLIASEIKRHLIYLLETFLGDEPVGVRLTKIFKDMKES